MENEILEIVDREGNITGHAERRVLHQDPSLLHRVVHVLLFNNSGGLLLQRRSMSKDTAPGKWDTSVGGHVNPDEAPYDAAVRELKEELGVSGCSPDYLYSYIYSDDRESELVNTYRCFLNGPVHFNKDEIDEVRYWDIDEIRQGLGAGMFSDHFEKEIRTYLADGIHR
ncbi:MAG: NUDIX domain-containing protein [Nitrospirae bacterium]|nr:NUDIX domain-containing protein [Nitrospirota bacterium]